MASEKRQSAFKKAAPKPQQMKSGKFTARQTYTRNEGIFVYRRPGRGQSGESSN